MPKALVVWITAILGVMGFFFFFPVYAGAVLEGGILSGYPSFFDGSGPPANYPSLLLSRSPLLLDLARIAALCFFLGWPTTLVSFCFAISAAVSSVRKKLGYWSSGILLFVCITTFIITLFLNIACPPPSLEKIWPFFVIWHLPLLIFLSWHGALILWLKKYAP